MHYSLCVCVCTSIKKETQSRIKDFSVFFFRSEKWEEASKRGNEKKMKNQQKQPKSSNILRHYLLFLQKMGFSIFLKSKKKREIQTTNHISY